MKVGGNIVNHFLIHSCAKTLAQKFKLKSRKAVFRKFGPLLSPIDELSTLQKNIHPNKKKKIEILKQNSLSKKREFNTNEVKDPLSVLN